MHSADPEKMSGELFVAFFDEFESIIRAAGAGIADFTYFMFPEVNFDSRRILASCNFFDVTFAGDVSFYSTIFQQNAYFERACFRKPINFSKCLFTHEADFYFTMFQSSAIFAECSFERGAVFSSALFEKSVDFHGVKFLRAARFRLTKFFSEEGPHTSSIEPSPIFSLASFAQPQNVLFYKTNLSRALFMNCDVSRINFYKVRWLRRRGNGKRMLYEEEIPLQDPYAEPLRLRSLESEDLEARELTREVALKAGLSTEVFFRDHSLIFDTYQQLKKNYDHKGDYWKAGDFHYGEMEMQRLSIRPGKEWLRFRMWWHPRFSLISWYKYASAYGESFLRPLSLMVFVLLFFTFCYPIVGIRNNLVSPVTPTTALTYRSVFFMEGNFHDRMWAELKLVGNSAISTLDVATFQRNTEYSPSYPWGRLLAILEAALSSTLFALFLLAVRRQFRR